MLLEAARAYLDEIRWDFGNVIRRPSEQGSVMLHFREAEGAEKSLDCWRAMADVYGGIVGLPAILLVADDDDLTITYGSPGQDVGAERRALQVMRNHKLSLVGADDVSSLSAPSSFRSEDRALGDALAAFQGQKVKAHWTHGNVVSMLWDCGRIMEVVYDAWGEPGYEIGIYEDLRRVSGAVGADWLVVLEAGGPEATVILPSV